MNEQAKINHYGPWQIPVSAEHVLCSDGIRRYARITSEPDTFFSIPASVKVKGKTVSGFITSRQYPNEKDLEFHAYSNKKNGGLLP